MRLTKDEKRFMAVLFDELVCSLIHAPGMSNIDIKKALKDKDALHLVKIANKVNDDVDRINIEERI